MMEFKQKSAHQPAVVTIGTKLFYVIIFILSMLIAAASILGILAGLAVGFAFLVSPPKDGMLMTYFLWSLGLLVVLATFTSWMTRAMFRKLTRSGTIEKSKNDEKHKPKYHA
jgi:cellulose synthase/poly-beta-1,6-N-acetylglucosamine synthase-like glycosyltransferase